MTYPAAGRYSQAGGAVKTLLGTLASLLLLFAAVWFLAPEWIPVSVRQVLQGRPADPRDDPQSPRYAPKVYRWTDAKGVTHVSDTPPAEGRYEEVRIDPDTNLIPGREPRGDE